ncbi:MAG: CaiB/BaiF CoA transferase family protein [Planctomycetota bacterium]
MSSKPMANAQRAPLDGVLVLDLSRVLAGPFASQQLADLGARVIKVESLDGGDATRGWGPPFIDADRSAYFLSCNRGKESIAIDLRHFEGAEIVRRLAARADAVVENFRGGQMAEWGLALDSLRAANPRLVTVSISGFGSDGPRRDEGGYDALVQAMSGIMAITGEVHGEWSKVGVAVVDVLAGMFAANALLGLLFGACAARTTAAATPARHAEVSLYDSALALLVNVTSSSLATGCDAGRYGNEHPSIVPYQVFAARDKKFFLAVGTDRQWRSLASALGQTSWLEEASWRTNAGRVRDRARLTARLAHHFAECEYAALEQKLQAVGVPLGPLRGVAEALADDVVTARGGILLHDDGTRSIASPMRLDHRPPLASPAPHLGEHTRRLLAEVGYSDAECAQLLAARIVVEH